jgi:hypothetical protein
LLLKATQALERIFNGVNAFLRRSLLRGMLELLIVQPAPVRQRPMATPAVNPAVPQQEGKKLLAFAAKVIGGRRLAGSHEIAHRLVSRVRRPNAGQLAGSMQLRQRDRVAHVRLDPLGRPFRDHGWSDDDAIVAESLNLAI